MCPDPFPMALWAFTSWWGSVGGIAPHGSRFNTCRGTLCRDQHIGWLAGSCVLKWAGGRTEVPGQHFGLPAGLRAAWTDFREGGIAPLPAGQQDPL